MSTRRSEYLRFPHVCGSQLVFVAEDDVWLASLDGGRAYRLTSDRAPAMNPRLHPDGSRVTWTSLRDGPAEVFVAPVGGGLATRLTYWGEFTTRTLGWANDDEVLAVTSAGQPTERDVRAHAVPSDTGPARMLPYGPVSDMALGPDGRALLNSAVTLEPAKWKRYRGGSAGKLWWNPECDGEFVRLLADLDGNLASPMLVGDRLAFLSDHEGWGNIYSVAADGRSDLRRHTDHGTKGAPDGQLAFYARHATSDGARIVYQCAGQPWILDSLDAPPRRLDIRLGGPRTATAPYQIGTEGQLSTAVPDHTGRLSVLGVRGTVHRLAHRDGPAATLAAAAGSRARLARPLGTDRAVWITDMTGEDAVEISLMSATALTEARPVRYGSGEIGRVLELGCAPDGSRVALACHDGRLLLLDTASGTITELARGVDGDVSGLTFSPDGTWLAWSDPVETRLRRILLAKVTDENPTPIAVTETRFVDTSPAFSSDGRYLAFLSHRSFDPIYDANTFDISFHNGCRPFLVPLSARTPSPFGASVDGRPVMGSGLDASEPAEPDEQGAADRAAEADDSGTAPTVVDVEGLARRLVALPVEAGLYQQLRAGKDCLLWLRSTPTGVLGDGLAEGAEVPRPTLERYDLARRRHDRIADPVDSFEVSGDGSRLLVRDRDTLRVLRTDRADSDLPRNDSADEFDVDLTRVSVTVDPTAEWRQMFDEAGRLMRDHYWTEDMAGIDWDAERARYRQLVDSVGSHDELLDLLWELQGELGTSHAYVISSRKNGSALWPGLLGADLERDEEGQWRVAAVLPGDSSAPRARSPLTEPGVDVRAGDVLLAVRGRPIDPTTGPAPLLLGTAGRPTELTIRSGEHQVRRVVVTPLHDEQQLRYHDWVAGRRAFVADRSEGRLGYLHIPDMVANGWAQLHRDLGREVAREGLIIDVRDNHGGHLSQLMIEKLARRVIAWSLVRHKQPITYPQDAPRGPVVAVANQFSGSDGDVVTAAFQRARIGPVVGVRTWGGVIGIDSRYALVDGTIVTQPRYSKWFVGEGWTVENNGVSPDHEVVMTPADHVAGRDPQLEKAVELAMTALAERAASVPPDPATRPSRVRPDLPPRPGRP